MASGKRARGKAGKGGRGGKRAGRAASGAEGRGDRRLFLERMGAIFGLAPELAEELVSRAPGRSVRINRLSPLDPETIRQRLQALGAVLTPIDWCADAYLLDSDKSAVAGSDLFRDGHVYLQNPSSLLPPLALDAQPGMRILDLCAAPGGKAAHLAARLGNDCELWVNDAIKPRVDKLRQILATYRVETAQVLTHEAQYIDKFVDARFDRILLDAQCSGDGMLDLRHPNALRFWNLARVRKYGYLQQRMLRAAFRLLKPGGVLVYSTCAFAPEENEAPVSALLEHVPEADLEPIGLALPQAMPGLLQWNGSRYDPRLAGALRIRPGGELEGFFVCRIRRRADA
jgi:16S rRNA C967 or C1407 C5-methylase (RsmB/RsmF family)